MKKKILYQFLIFSAVILFTAISGNVYAQPCPEGCSGPNCEFCVDPSTVPLDGGVGFLLVSGIVLGIRKIYRKNQ